MGNDRLIYIRTDGNSKIASGHLVRCFSIALACQSIGMEVRFLVSDRESLHLLKEISGTCELPILQLKTASFDHFDRELPEVVSLLAKEKNTHVIYFIDSYYVTEKYLSTLKPLVKTVYLDDLQSFDYPVDLLINYDVISSADMPSYKDFYQSAGQLLLGSFYTPLRGQFQNRLAHTRKKVSDVLVTTGGSDPCHFCLDLIHYIDDYSASPTAKDLLYVKFHIVIGQLNTDKEELYRLANIFPFLELHENVSDMASLMAGCDLAISAAGTTLYELCALGIPAISFAMADNQLCTAKAFDQVQAIPWAGDIRTSLSEALTKILQFIAENINPLSNSYDKRKAAHNAMRNLVDGNGSLRIAYALREL